MSDLWRVAGDLEEGRKPFVVVTMIAEKGHAPQDPGAKAIVTADGLHFGTVGGGKVEARAILHAKELLASGERGPRLVTWNLQRDIGMTCGGEVSYLFETHGAQAWHIVIFGAGHVAQSLVRVLLNLDCRVTCVDSRSEWLAKLPSSPKLSAVHAEEPAQFVESCPATSFFVVVTQGHGTDLPILEEIARTRPQAPYVGAIGSPVKAERLRRDLLTKRVPADWLERFRCPIGLPLGSNHPGEIAISIAAQLLLVREGAGVDERPVSSPSDLGRIQSSV